MGRGHSANLAFAVIRVVLPQPVHGLAVRAHCANLCPMPSRLSPIVSEFETEELEASYDQWFRAKVEEALRSEKPRLPHDAAVAKVQALLEERRKGRANTPLV